MDGYTLYYLYLLHILVLDRCWVDIIIYIVADK